MPRTAVPFLGTPYRQSLRLRESTRAVSGLEMLAIDYAVSI